MKKINSLLTVLLLVSSAVAQNVGINTTTPNAAVDINGDIAFRSQPLNVADGITYVLDVNSNKYSNYRLSGPTSNFVIAGITAGLDGRIIILNNRSGHSMELYDEDVTAIPANRIRTGTDATLAIYNNGTATLQYDVAASRWQVLGRHNSSLDNFGNNTLPATSIVLSDLENNTNLTAANFSLAGEMQLTVSVYQPGTFAWGIPPSPANAPATQGEHTAVWTGDKLVVWGGYDNSSGNYLSDGKAYNYSANSWANLSASGLAPRSLHTAQWTGTEMLVWGGIGEFQTMGNGAKYNPTTDSWVSISNTNAPTSRFDFTSIWTGTEMIVFGGRFAGTNYRTDNKKYNPSSDVWTDVSATNAPAPRIYHTAIWTGSQMIVFGGKLIDGLSTNTGYTYDPVSDVWTAISLSGAPPNGLSEHTAIWTGTEMIVFGGRKNPNGVESNFYLYNPVTDTWRQGSNLNKPIGTIYHSAVWNGTEMIVYGGFDNIIGIYNPQTDTWHTGPLSNPYSFSKHTATVINNEMLVVGANAPQRLKKGITTPASKIYYLYKKN